MYAHTYVCACVLPICLGSSNMFAYAIRLSRAFAYVLLECVAIRTYTRRYDACAAELAFINYSAHGLACQTISTHTQRNMYVQFLC